MKHLKSVPEARNWYQESREVIQREYGNDWQLFAGLLAATSPHNGVKGNWTMAKKAYNQVKHNHPITGFMKCHRMGIEAVASGKLPNGRKVKSFYLNLVGDESVVTVDVWVCRAFNNVTDSPTKKQYDRYERLIQAQAKRMGITPAQRQAEIWAAIRGSAESFATVANLKK